MDRYVTYFSLGLAAVAILTALSRTIRAFRHGHGWRWLAISWKYDFFQILLVVAITAAALLINIYVAPHFTDNGSAGFFGSLAIPILLGLYVNSKLEQRRAVERGDEI